MLPKIETILYCTGLGPNAPYVFRHAYAMARQLGARIVALHVIESLSPRQRALVEGYSGLGSLTEILKKAEQEAASQLPRRIEELCAREAPGDGSVRARSPEHRMSIRSTSVSCWTACYVSGRWRSPR